MSTSLGTVVWALKAFVPQRTRRWFRSQARMLRRQRLAVYRCSLMPGSNTVGSGRRYQAIRELFPTGDCTMLPANKFSGPRQGLTLIELLIVLLILVALSALIVPMVPNVFTRARTSTAPAPATQDQQAPAK